MNCLVGLGSRQSVGSVMVSSSQVSSGRFRKYSTAVHQVTQHKDTTHKRLVYFDGKMAVLPRGPHGRRKKYNIEIGHVKQLIRLFNISDCVREYFPGDNIV